MFSVLFHCDHLCCASTETWQNLAILWMHVRKGHSSKVWCSISLQWLPSVLLWQSVLQATWEISRPVNMCQKKTFLKSLILYMMMVVTHIVVWLRGFQPSPRPVWCTVSLLPLPLGLLQVKKSCFLVSEYLQSMHPFSALVVSFPQSAIWSRLIKVHDWAFLLLCFLPSIIDGSAIHHRWEYHCIIREAWMFTHS